MRNAKLGFQVKDLQTGEWFNVEARQTVRRQSAWVGQEEQLEALEWFKLFQQYQTIDYSAWKIYAVIHENSWMIH